MEINAKIAPWTHGRHLNSLQMAASELIPHGFSIALSIRELVRQGYLISAEILLRPLVERAGVVSYLCDNTNKLSLWEKGWPASSRPKLYELLAAMRGGKNNVIENEDMARKVAKEFHAIVHADPLGSRKQAAMMGDGRSGYSASKSLKDTEKCDDICFQAACYLIVLMARAVQIFKEALDQGIDIIESKQ